jgi:glycerate kinase
MKFVLAPDKFKDSLTGLEFCEAAKEGLLKVFPDANIVFCPLADGGDGTIEVANYFLTGELITTEVKNPLFNAINATYLYDSASQIAFIEMAEASGLKLLKVHERDCKNTSTLGTGQLIMDAINRGAKEIILGIGGSATNDCGIGMATAFGYRFLDKNDKELKPIGANLSKIVGIDDSQVSPTLKNVIFKIACDVTNPLYGKNGAAYIYAKQKGANENDIKFLDKGLEDFSKVLDRKFPIKSQKIIGGGAAGGMGVGAIVFLNGELVPGITLLKELAEFESKIKDADWIITGEGKLDEQTLSGKTIKGVMDDAKQHNVKVATFCGALDLTENQLKQFGISYADEVFHKAENIDDAMNNAGKYVTRIAEEFAKRLLK